MSISLGPEDICLAHPPSQPSRGRNVPRRRTVSTSFEQNRVAKNQNRSLDMLGRQTQSCAQDMAGLTQNVLKKNGIFNSFVEKHNEVLESEEKESWWESPEYQSPVLVF